MKMMIEPKSTVPNEVEPEKGPVQVRKRVFSQRTRIGVGMQLGEQGEGRCWVGAGTFRSAEQLPSMPKEKYST